MSEIKRNNVTTFCFLKKEKKESKKKKQTKKGNRDIRVRLLNMRKTERRVELSSRVCSR